MCLITSRAETTSKGKQRKKLKIKYHSCINGEGISVAEVWFLIGKTITYDNEENKVMAKRIQRLTSMTDDGKGNLMAQTTTNVTDQGSKQLEKEPLSQL